MAAAVAVAVGLCCQVVASSLLSSRRPTWQCEWEPATRITFRHATDIYVHVHTAPSAPARTGNTGEGYILDVAERRTLTEVCVDECSKASKCSIIHVGHPDTPTALALGVHAKEAGADAISSMPPFQVRVCTLKHAWLPACMLLLRESGAVHACTAMPACSCCVRVAPCMLALPCLHAPHAYQATTSPPEWRPLRAHEFLNSQRKRNTT
jgi:hypothetical protein